MSAEAASDSDVSGGLTRRTRVVVFHAPGCHLCERALEIVRGARETIEFDLEEIDISSDPALEAGYREWLPVVEIDGRRRFTYHVHPDSFRAAVAQAGR
jgi:glutaredoxin